MKKPYKKYHRIKKKKPIFKFRLFWLGILIVLGTSLFIYFLFFFPAFQIKNIEIEGTSFVQENNLRELVESFVKRKFLFLESKSILILSKNNLKKLILEKNLEIKDLEIKKKLPDSLIIEVSERVPVANFCWENDCYFLDEEGIIFRKSDSKNLVIKTEKGNLKLGDQVIEKDLLEKVLKIARTLESKFSIKTEEFTVSSLKIEVKTDKNWILIFNPQKDLNWQIQELELVLERQIPEEKIEDLEYIDLRFDKIFYKFK
jgi:cell division protein FtsQ